MFWRKKQTDLPPLKSGIINLSMEETRNPTEWVDEFSHLTPVNVSKYENNKKIYIVLSQGEKRVGQATFEERAESLDLNGIYVGKNVRKKGIATGFLKFMKNESNKNINGDTIRTTNGRDMWESLVKNGEAYYDETERRYKLY